MVFTLNLDFFRRTIVNPKTGQEAPDPDGKRHGMGVRVWTTGAKYMGDWAAGRHQLKFLWLMFRK